MARYHEDGYLVDMCGKCGNEGPLREGEIELCISSCGGALMLQLCRQCREATTVEQALELLTKGPRPRRISLLDQVAALAARVEAVGRAFELLREDLHRRLAARSTRHHSAPDDVDAALAEVAAAAQTVADSLASAPSSVYLDPVSEKR